MTMKSRDQFLWINFLAKSEKFWMAILIMICGMYVAIWWCQCHTYFGILVALFRMSVWITSKKKRKRENKNDTQTCIVLAMILLYRKWTNLKLSECCFSFFFIISSRNNYITIHYFAHCVLFISSVKWFSFSICLFRLQQNTYTAYKPQNKSNNFLWKFVMTAGK